ncbi:hypothetical protein [Desulfurivibrio alkaliphilus]|uniref:Uncharacterized protein n=1 Tax=Desulfurivibrio alkaliphilus (strain DSM 19089 / UNIQEM U267 / AHT2) TaxID=589865 RepID=D6Z0U0_DESAT|nr:hypothetical protein [Desulfurivibrio alkaliphilus]ADH87200.1 hypothetical protein DaAHT2_2536 [Desulfurivibrio alkaliphilus AHT 2]
MRREMPRTTVPQVAARMPRWLIQPVRIIIFTGFLLAALFIFTAPSLTLIQVLLITVQVVFSLAVLAECGRSAEHYRVVDEAQEAARKREQDGMF